jgi:hypothetical protein
LSKEKSTIINITTDESETSKPITPEQHIIKPHQQSLEKYCYKFDNPMANDWGYVQINQKSIQVNFPEKNSHVDYLIPTRDIQIYVNKQLMFHSHWLPTFTIQDILKYKTMFRRAYHEFGNLVNYFFCPSTYFLPPDFTALETIFNQNTFYLSCFENNTTTWIEFESKTDTTDMIPVSSTLPIHVQFYIGSHLTFSSYPLQQKLTTETYHFVLSFILYKCMS